MPNARPRSGESWLGLIEVWCSDAGPHAVAEGRQQFVKQSVLLPQ